MILGLLPWCIVLAIGYAWPLFAALTFPAVLLLALALPSLFPPTACLTPAAHMKPMPGMNDQIVTFFYAGLGGSWQQALRYAGPEGLPCGVSLQLGDRVIPLPNATAWRAPHLLYGLCPINPPEVVELGWAASLLARPAALPWIWTALLTQVGQAMHGTRMGTDYFIDVPRVSFAQHDDIQQFLTRVRTHWDKPEFKERFVVLAGTSRGASTVLGAVTLMTVEEQARVGLVVLEGAFDSVPSVAAARYGTWLGGTLLPLLLSWTTRYDPAASTPLELAQGFPWHVPVAVITSKVDWQVPMVNTLCVRDAILKARAGVKDAAAVHTLILETSHHSRYATDNIEDQTRYRQFMDALYAQYVPTATND